MYMYGTCIHVRYFNIFQMSKLPLTFLLYGSVHLIEILFLIDRYWKIIDNHI